MATDDEIKKEQQLNQEKKKGIDLNQKSNTSQDRARQILADLVNDQRTLNAELRDQLGIRQTTDDFGKALLKLSREITKSTEQNTVALGRSGQLSKQILQDDTNLEAAKRELAISTIGVKQEEIDAAKLLQSVNNQIIGQQKELEELEQSMLDMNEKELEVALERKKKIIEQNADLEGQRGFILETASKETERIALAQQLVDNAQKQVDLRKEEAATQKEINKAMGVTGAVTQSAKLLTEGLGLGSLANLFNIQEANKQIEHEIDLLVRAAEERGESVKQTDILAVKTRAVGKMLGGAVDTAFSFESILSSVVGEYLKFNKVQVEGQRLTGQTMGAFEGLNTSVASTRDVLELSNELTKELGFNANNIFKPSVLQGAAELQKTLGLSAHEAGKLALLSQKTGKPVKAVASEIVDQVSAFNAANKQAVSQGVIMKDIGEASKAVSLSLGSNPKLLAKAAAEARRLGMSLNDLDKVAGSLLDFESSIGAEIEAQLLTGQSMNLAKARELALNNDLAGVGKELFKNAGDVSKFGKMNRIQQEAQAKALGMSRDQLAKIAYQQALNTKMTKEQAAAAAGVSLEDMERMAATENFQQAITKLSGALAPLINIIGDLMSLPLAPYILIAGGAFYKFGSQMSGVVKGFGKLRENVSGFIKDIAGGKGIGDRLKSMLPGGDKKTPDLDKSKELTKSTKGMDPKKGEGTKGFLKGLAEGLREMAGVKVLQGALNLIPASIGMVAMIPGAVGAKLVEFINGAKLQESLSGIGKGLTEMAGGKVLAGALILIPASIGLTALALAAPGLAILSMIPGKALETLLGGLGRGLAALGNALMGPQLLGLAAGLVLLTGSIIGIGFALKLAAPAFTAIGTVVSGIFSGIATVITAAAEGFVMLLGAVTMDNIGPLFLLGPALISAAAGIALFSAAMAGGSIATGLTSLFTGGGILADLQTLADMAPALDTVGTSLTAIAAGLAGVALALSTLETEKISELKDLVMTTAFAAPMVAATGAITSLISGMTGGGEGGNDAIAAKLDELIAAVKEGGDVFIDGSKAGNALVLASSKSS